MNNKVLVIVAVVVVIILIAVGVMYSGQTPEPTEQPIENSAAVVEPISAAEAEINAVDLGGDVDASLEDVDAQINSL